MWSPSETRTDWNLYIRVSITTTFNLVSLQTSPKHKSTYTPNRQLHNTMVSSGEKVLVFGPTGAVGSTAALEAHRRGANVFLAMRDPKKPIKGLDDSEGYTRIQADLSDPETVTKAIETSGAKTVFVYMIHESKDNMASTFRTMKDAGIQHVVLLSSFTIKGAPEEEANMVNYIPRVHAQTEIALRDSGIPYTAVSTSSWVMYVIH